MTTKPKSRKEITLDVLMFCLLIAATLITLFVAAYGMVGILGTKASTTYQNTTVISEYTTASCVLWCAGTEYHVIIANASVGYGPIDVKTNAVIYYTHPVGSVYVDAVTHYDSAPFAPVYLIVGVLGFYIMGRIWASVFEDRP